MNEAQTRKALIDPALRAAGWDTAPAHWQPEFPVSLGRIGSDAKHHNPKFADYVLFFGKKRIAVVEAKRAMRDFDAGEAQARFYGEALGVRFAYATNGVKVLEFDRGGKAFMDAFAKSKYVAPKINQNGKWGLTREGRIHIQDHGDSTVSYRNIKIKEL